MPARCERGFMLLEGLVALLMATIALLGLAYAQVYAHTSTTLTQYRASAANLAGEIVAQVLMDSANIGCYVLKRDGLPKTVNGKPTECASPAARAYMQAWIARLAVLPSAGPDHPHTIVITSDGVFTVTLRWDLAKDSLLAELSVPRQLSVATQVLP